MPHQSSLTVREELIEDIIARANFDCSPKSSQQSVVWELLGKREYANFNLALDIIEALMRAAQIGFRWRTLDRRAVSDTLDREVELDSTVGAATTPPVNHLLPICFSPEYPKSEGRPLASRHYKSVCSSRPAEP